MVTTTRTDEARTHARVSAVLSAGYGLGAYLAFVLVSCYAVAFTADLSAPRTVDRGGPQVGAVAAVVVDAVLLGVFALQHSVMARPAFKQRWAMVVPRHLERSTYVWAASAALALVFWEWCPIPTVVWDVSLPAARVLMWTLFALGWAWVVAMSFAIDHLDLFGLRQVARHLRGLAEWTPSFAVPWPHRLARHPMMLGFFPAFLSAPTMTAGHLLFAGLGCAYILVGVRLEERDLKETLPEYRAYAAITPRFVPRLPRRRR